MARKSGLGSLLLAGAAAYGLYRVSKMSAQERSDLLDKGKKLVNDNLGGMKNAFGRNGSSPDAKEQNFTRDVSYGG